MEIIELYFNPKENEENLYQTFVLDLGGKIFLFGFLVIENSSPKTRRYFLKTEKEIKKNKNLAKESLTEFLLRLNYFIWHSPLEVNENIKFLIGLIKPDLKLNEYLLQLSWIGDVDVIVEEEKIIDAYPQPSNRFQRIREIKIKPNRIIWFLEKELSRQFQEKNIFSTFLANFNASGSLPKEVKKFFKNIDFQALSGVGLIFKTRDLKIKKYREKAKKIFRYLNSIVLPSKAVYPLLLLIFLFVSLPIFNYEKKVNAEVIKNQIEILKQEVKLGNFYLKKKQNQKAKTLLLEAWEFKTKLEEENNLRNFPEFKIIEQSLYQNLLILFNVKKVTKTDLVYQINPKEIVTEKIECLDNTLILLSPFQQKLLLPDKNKLIFEQFNLAASNFNKNSLVLYSASDNSLKILKFTNKDLKSIEKKALSYQKESPFIDLATYLSNFYLLDKALIVWKGNLEKDIIAPYLNLEKIGLTSLPDEFQIDGPFWFLNSEKKLISKYQDQELKSINLGSIFPPVLKPANLLTSPSFNYLYFSDPLTKRIIALKKSDYSLRQFQFPVLSDIKSFCLSQDEKEIFILTDNKILKTKLSF